VIAARLYSAHSLLSIGDIATPQPGRGEIRIRVRACAVCRTDLHIIDGELAHPKLPLVLGHQIAGVVDSLGADASAFSIGDRVGVPWLAWTDGSCRFCTTGRENLCDRARFTGYDVDGGFAEYAVADERYCFPLPAGFDFAHAAPLMCAGLIGYRAFAMAGDSQKLGIYGFGAAAHIIAQVAIYKGRRVFAFTRPGDEKTQAFARSLGAIWAGGSDESPPENLDAAIIFAPAGELVPAALRALDKGGTVVCGGIHMSEIPAFDYDLLWGERVLRSVANLTRRDAREFLQLAEAAKIQTHVTTFALKQINDAIAALRRGDIDGSAVIVMDESR
jgi:alcohol dehydrogenase, propanol-preferring